MDATETMRQRMACLDLAVQVCRMTNDSYGVISKAQDMWDWLVKDQALVPAKPSPSTDDDIPF